MSHPQVSHGIASAVLPAPPTDWNTTWQHHTILVHFSPTLSGWVHPEVGLMALVLIIIIEHFFSPHRQGSVIWSWWSPAVASVLIASSQIFKPVVMTAAEIAGPTIKLAANLVVFLCVVFVDDDPPLEHNREQWHLGLTSGNSACNVINLFVLQKLFYHSACRKAECGWDACVFLGRAQVSLDSQIEEFCLCLGFRDALLWTKCGSTWPGWSQRWIIPFLLLE